MTYHPEEVLLEQVPDQDHGASMFNGEQLNDPIDQDDNTDNVVEDDGTNTLIHDSFNIRMDDDDDDDNENIDDFDDVHDITLLNKENEPLYEGSKTNLLSTECRQQNISISVDYLTLECWDFDSCSGGYPTLPFWIGVKFPTRVVAVIRHFPIGSSTYMNQT